MRTITVLAANLTGLLLLGGSAWAADVRDIELRRLFEPTPGELAQEASGRIYIYEGLRESDVARAMTEEFDRVDTMMFVRMKRVAPKAKPDSKEPPTYYTDDDGC